MCGVGANQLWVIVCVLAVLCFAIPRTPTTTTRTAAGTAARVSGTQLRDDSDLMEQRNDLERVPDIREERLHALQQRNYAMEAFMARNTPSMSPSSSPSPGVVVELGSAFRYTPGVWKTVYKMLPFFWGTPDKNIPENVRCTENGWHCATPCTILPTMPESKYGYCMSQTTMVGKCVSPAEDCFALKPNQLLTSGFIEGKRHFVVFGITLYKLQCAKTFTGEWLEDRIVDEIAKTLRPLHVAPPSIDVLEFTVKKNGKVIFPKPTTDFTSPSPSPSPQNPEDSTLKQSTDSTHHRLQDVLDFGEPKVLRELKRKNDSSTWFAGTDDAVDDDLDLVTGVFSSTTDGLIDALDDVTLENIIPLDDERKNQGQKHLDTSETILSGYEARDEPVASALALDHHVPSLDETSVNVRISVNPENSASVIQLLSSFASVGSQYVLSLAAKGIRINGLSITTLTEDQEDTPNQSILFSTKVFLGSSLEPSEFMENYSVQFTNAIAKQVGVASRDVVLSSVRAGLEIEFRILVAHNWDARSKILRLTQVLNDEALAFQTVLERELGIYVPPLKVLGAPRVVMGEVPDLMRIESFGFSSSFEAHRTDSCSRIEKSGDSMLREVLRRYSPKRSQADQPAQVAVRAYKTSVLRDALALLSRGVGSRHDAPITWDILEASLKPFKFSEARLKELNTMVLPPGTPEVSLTTFLQAYSSGMFGRSFAPSYVATHSYDRLQSIGASKLVVEAIQNTIKVHFAQYSVGVCELLEASGIFPLSASSIPRIESLVLSMQYYGMDDSGRISVKHVYDKLISFPHMGKDTAESIAQILAFMSPSKSELRTTRGQLLLTSKNDLALYSLTIFEMRACLLAGILPFIDFETTPLKASLAAETMHVTLQHLQEQFHEIDVYHKQHILIEDLLLWLQRFGIDAEKANLLKNYIGPDVSFEGVVAAGLLGYLPLIFPNDIGLERRKDVTTAREVKQIKALCRAYREYVMDVQSAAQSKHSANIEAGLLAEMKKVLEANGIARDDVALAIAQLLTLHEPANANSIEIDFDVFASAFRKGFLPPPNHAKHSFNPPQWFTNSLEEYKLLKTEGSKHPETYSKAWLEERLAKILGITSHVESVLTLQALPAPKADLAVGAVWREVMFRVFPSSPADKLKVLDLLKRFAALQANFRTGRLSQAETTAFFSKHQCGSSDTGDHVVFDHISHASDRGMKMSDYLRLNENHMLPTFNIRESFFSSSLKFESCTEMEQTMWNIRRLYENIAVKHSTDVLLPHQFNSVQLTSEALLSYLRETASEHNFDSSLEWTPLQQLVKSTIETNGIVSFRTFSRLVTMGLIPGTSWALAPRNVNAISASDIPLAVAGAATVREVQEICSLYLRYSLESESLMLDSESWQLQLKQELQADIVPVLVAAVTVGRVVPLWEFASIVRQGILPTRLVPTVENLAIWNDIQVKLPLGGPKISSLSKILELKEYFGRFSDSATVSKVAALIAKQFPDPGSDVITTQHIERGGLHGLLPNPESEDFKILFREAKTFLQLFPTDQTVNEIETANILEMQGLTRDIATVITEAMSLLRVGWTANFLDFHRLASSGVLVLSTSADDVSKIDVFGTIEAFAMIVEQFPKNFASFSEFLSFIGITDPTHQQLLEKQAGARLLLWGSGDMGNQFSTFVDLVALRIIPLVQRHEQEMAVNLNQNKEDSGSLFAEIQWTHLSPFRNSSRIEGSGLEYLAVKNVLTPEEAISELGAPAVSSNLESPMGADEEYSIWLRVENIHGSELIQKYNRESIWFESNDISRKNHDEVIVTQAEDIFSLPLSQNSNFVVLRLGKRVAMNVLRLCICEMKSCFMSADKNALLDSTGRGSEQSRYLKAFSSDFGAKGMPVIHVSAFELSRDMHSIETIDGVTQTLKLTIAGAVWSHPSETQYIGIDPSRLCIQKSRLFVEFTKSCLFPELSISPETGSNIVTTPDSANHVVVISLRLSEASSSSIRDFCGMQGAQSKKIPTPCFISYQRGFIHGINAANAPPVFPLHAVMESGVPIDLQLPDPALIGASGHDSGKSLRLYFDRPMPPEDIEKFQDDLFSGTTGALTNSGWKVDKTSLSHVFVKLNADPKTQMFDAASQYGVRFGVGDGVNIIQPPRIKRVCVHEERSLLRHGKPASEIYVLLEFGQVPSAPSFAVSNAEVLEPVKIDKSQFSIDSLVLSLPDNTQVNLDSRRNIETDYIDVCAMATKPVLKREEGVSRESPSNVIVFRYGPDADVGDLIFRAKVQTLGSFDSSKKLPNTFGSSVMMSMKIKELSVKLLESFVFNEELNVPVTFTTKEQQLQTCTVSDCIPQVSGKLLFGDDRYSLRWARYFAPLVAVAVSNSLDVVVSNVFISQVYTGTIVEFRALSKSHWYQLLLDLDNGSFTEKLNQLIDDETRRFDNPPQLIEANLGVFGLMNLLSVEYSAKVGLKLSFSQTIRIDPEHFTKLKDAIKVFRIRDRSQKVRTDVSGCHYNGPKLAFSNLEELIFPSQVSVEILPDDATKLLISRPPPLQNHTAMDLKDQKSFMLQFNHGYVPEIELTDLFVCLEPGFVKHKWIEDLTTTPLEELQKVLDVDYEEKVRLRDETKQLVHVVSWNIASENFNPFQFLWAPPVGEVADTFAKKIKAGGKDTLSKFENIVKDLEVAAKSQCDISTEHIREMKQEWQTIRELKISQFLEIERKKNDLERVDRQTNTFIFEKDGLNDVVEYRPSPVSCSDFVLPTDNPQETWWNKWKATVVTKKYCNRISGAKAIMLLKLALFDASMLDLLGASKPDWNGIRRAVCDEGVNLISRRSKVTAVLQAHADADLFLLQSVSREMIDHLQSNMPDFRIFWPSVTDHVDNSVIIAKKAKFPNDPVDVTKKILPRHSPTARTLALELVDNLGAHYLTVSHKQTNYETALLDGLLSFSNSNRTTKSNVIQPSSSLPKYILGVSYNAPKFFSTFMEAAQQKSIASLVNDIQTIPTDMFPVGSMEVPEGVNGDIASQKHKPSDSILYLPAQTSPYWVRGSVDESGTYAITEMRMVSTLPTYSFPSHHMMLVAQLGPS